jgi:hypothetical protein
VASVAVGTTSSTLTSVIERSWEGLWNAGGTPCPLCEQRMQLRNGAGRCSACGTVLS